MPIPDPRLVCKHEGRSQGGGIAGSFSLLPMRVGTINSQGSIWCEGDVINHKDKIITTEASKVSSLRHNSQVQDSSSAGSTMEPIDPRLL